MPASPATEAMLTIAPRPRSSMMRSAARVHAKVPKRWTSSMRRHSASSMRLVTPSERRAPPMIAWKACSVCARSRGESSPMPALLARMSTVPHSRTTRAKSASTCALSATSVGTPMAVPPSARISAATRSALSRFRSATATCAPSAAKRRAIARPIPDPPPVTTATRLVSRAMRRLSTIHRRESPRAGGGQRTFATLPLLWSARGGECQAVFSLDSYRVRVRPTACPTVRCQEEPPMDASRFDVFTRAFGAGLSGRRLAKVLATLLLGMALAGWAPRPAGACGCDGACDDTDPACGNRTTCNICTDNYQRFLRTKSTGVLGGGGVRLTDGAAAHLDVVATRVGPDAPGAPSAVLGQVAWVDPNRGVRLVSVRLLDYGPLPDERRGREVVGLAQVTGVDGEAPFVLRVVVAGPARHGSSTVHLVAGDPARERLAGLLDPLPAPSGFAYEADGKLLGGGIKLLQFQSGRSRHGARGGAR